MCVCMCVREHGNRASLVLFIEAISWQQTCVQALKTSLRSDWSLDLTAVASGGELSESETAVAVMDEGKEVESEPLLMWGVFAGKFGVC